MSHTAGNMDAVFEAVDRCDFSLASLVAAAHDLNLILQKVSTQWQREHRSGLTSLRIGILRTPCFSRSSLLRGA
jgi:hypothetical protein